MVFLGAAAAVVLLAASPAFACLTQKGQLTLTPSGGSSYTVTGDAYNGDMKWCSWPTSAPSIAKGGSVRVQVASGSCPFASSSQLSNGTYTIRLNSNTTSPQWKLVSGSWQFQSGTGCWASTPPPSGTIDLDTSYSVSSGSGDETVTIPNNSTVNVSDVGPPAEAAGLCVGNLNSSGIFGPLKITA